MLLKKIDDKVPGKNRTTRTEEQGAQQDADEKWSWICNREHSADPGDFLPEGDENMDENPL
jgi:hypothetical protein